MGIGDDIIATGMARGAKTRGKRIAFGDRTRIKWGPYSAMIFQGNPNIAPPGSEKARDIEWIEYYKGHRIYNSSGGNRWIWNYSFKVTPGELFLEDTKDNVPDDLILIEPNVPDKPCGPNKQWPVDRFRLLASRLSRLGSVRQFSYGAPNVVAEGISTKGFRDAARLLSKARIAILPEGGLHHAAAAVGTKAVVLFGGFTPPSVLGYDAHSNLTGGALACGSFTACPHCLHAMSQITVDQVVNEVERLIC